MYRSTTDIHDLIRRKLPEIEAAHMYRVGGLVHMISKAIWDAGNCSEDYLYFGEAAYYHDIGKIMIPHNILLKEDKLSYEEYLLVLGHPLFARTLFGQMQKGEICGILPSLLAPAFDAGVYHHERWDGNGYPYGLKKQEIPLIARITAVCDAYDAITNNRPYQVARTHEQACEELRRNAGTQFDPLLVCVFLQYEACIAAHAGECSHTQAWWSPKEYYRRESM